MNKNHLIRTLHARPTVLALALLAAFGTAGAQEVEGSVSVGAGVLSGNRADRSLYDQYNGLRPGSSGVGLFSADYYRRDDERGTATQFQASDLFNGDRELDFRWKKPGDWKFSAGYRELQRQSFDIPNSGLVGAGTATPQVLPLVGGPGTGSDLDLKTKRSNLGLGFSKVLTRQWQFDVSLQTEKKEGSRLFGVGMNCPSAVAPGCLGTTSVAAGWALLMLPEPIDSNHTQAEGRVTFAGDKLSLSMGYYGSFYRNDNGSLNPNVPASLYGPLGGIRPLAAGLQPILNNPVALPPDNQAHQLDLTGVYAFTRTTRLNFKLGYSQASQQQNFAAAGFAAAPAGVGDLGAKLATSLAQVGISARPMPKLSLNANLRYEHRSDSTPLAPYIVEDTTAFTNRHYPLTTTKGKVEAGYQFTSDYRGTLGATFNNVDRGTFTPSSAIEGVTALRQKTEETGIRAELRKRMSEVLSGAVALESSRRNGSNWLRDNGGAGVTEVTDANSAAAQTVFATGIFPVNLMDRRRDKIRLNADWQATDNLSLQGVVEAGRDRYDAPSIYGVHKSGMDQITIDATYAISEKWNVNGFLSNGRQELDQARPGAAFIAFDNRSTTLGLGVTGNLSSKLQLGGNLAWMHDRNIYAQTLDATADAGSVALLAATGGLPDIVFQQATLKLFGKYTIDKQSAVRLDLVHQRSKWNDWAWGYNGTPFVYSDGTTINRKSQQNVSFLGLTYVRRWP